MPRRNDPRRARVGQTWYVVDFRGVHAVHLTTPFDLECFQIFYVSWPNAMFGKKEFCTRSKRKALRKSGRRMWRSKPAGVFAGVPERGMGVFSDFVAVKHLPQFVSADVREGLGCVGQSGLDEPDAFPDAIPDEDDFSFMTPRKISVEEWSK